MPLGVFLSETQFSTQRYSTFDRELLGIYLSIRHFRYFVEGHDFFIVTDHKPLTYAITARSTTTPLVKLASWTTFPSIRCLSFARLFQQCLDVDALSLALPAYPLTYPHWPKLNRMRISPQRLRVPPFCYNLLSFPPQTSPFSVTWLQGLLALMYLKNYDVSYSHNSMVFHILEFVPHNAW